MVAKSKKPKKADKPKSQAARKKPRRRQHEIVIPQEVERTLAPRARWETYRNRILADKSKLYLDRRRERELRDHIRARALIAHPEPGPAPLSGAMAEYALAAAIQPRIEIAEAHVLDTLREGVPARTVKSNDKEYFDVVLEYAYGDNAAWQVKTLNNRKRRDNAVLMNISKDDIGYKKSIKPREMAERVFAKVREKQAIDEERWRINDSRCVFFIGDPKSNTMMIWQEPYYPGEIDLDAFEWKKLDSGGFAGYLDGESIWTWYPRNGQLKHKLHIPQQGKVISVPLPEESLSVKEFQRRMLAPR